MGMKVCAAVLLLTCPGLVAQNVTETKWVENWETGHGKALLRKINGRWWSEDNREVTPPADGQSFWTLDSKPGVCQFFHHRPFQMSKAESLHLWMTRDQVEAVLGQAGRTCESSRGQSGFWHYYASNGVRLTVRFMSEGGLGEARYEPLGAKSYSVASVESELGGKTIYELGAERARKKVEENDALRRAEFQREHAIRGRVTGSRSTPASVIAAENANAAQTVAPAEKRIVAADALAAITSGVSREDVLSKLGEPNGRYSITGDEGTRESFTYALDDGRDVVVRLLNGKVTTVQ